MKLSKREAHALRERFVQLLQDTVDKTTFGVSIDSRVASVRANQLRALYHERVSADDVLFLHSLQSIQMPDDSVAEFTRELTTLLEDCIYDDRIGHNLFCSEGKSTALHIPSFAEETVCAAAIRGAGLVTDLICEWVQQSDVPYRICAVLSGIEIDEPLELGPGIQLTMLHSSDESEAHVPRIAREFGLPFFDFVGCVKVSIERAAPLGFYKHPEKETQQQQIWRDQQDQDLRVLEMLCDALSLDRNSPISWHIRWLECDETRGFRSLSVPISATDSPEPRPLRKVPIAKGDVDHIQSLLTKRNHKGVSQGGLDLAISRWRRSMVPRGYDNQFIELRIALEALYLGRNSQELVFRLTNYGAWHLGSDFDDRHEIRKTLRRAYEMGSRAAHAGTVPHDQKTYDLLRAAQDLCRRGILKRLNESEEPRWSDLILGAC